MGAAKRNAEARPRLSLVCLLLLAACQGARLDTAAHETLLPTRPHRLAPDGLEDRLDNGRYGRIRLLGALELTRATIDGNRLLGLSALAWDDDENTLYALSDRARLFHLRPRFTEGRLTALEALAAHPLRGADGHPLQGPASDAEGLALRGERNGRSGDTRLLVAFERRPRLVEYAPDGAFLRHHRLPAPLEDAAAYASPNKALEAAAHHPRLGILVAPEWPLRAAAPERFTLHALDGRGWKYPRAPYPHNALVALEASPEGSLLALERGYEILPPRLIVALRRLHPEAGERPGGVEEVARVEELAVMDSAEGWHLDNFEGLARHAGQRYFAVSDDNGSPLQRTLLLYFEVLDGSPREATGHAAGP